jgi:muramoyltetrapeptide carboxypeptidase
MTIKEPRYLNSLIRFNLSKLFTVLVLYSIKSIPNMIAPAILQKGDTIAILATARKNIDDNLKPAIDLLHSWGLEVVIGSTIGLDNNQLVGTAAYS